MEEEEEEEDARGLEREHIFPALNEAVLVGFGNRNLGHGDLERRFQS